GVLLGLVAAYWNDREKRVAYITNVSVLKGWMGKQIAARLLLDCVEYAKASGIRQLGLEVAVGNTPAIKLYEKSGFVAVNANAAFVDMALMFESGDTHE